MEKHDANLSLILFLLQSDLRNNKLIYNLYNAGLVAEDFYTDLCKPIFQLMGFEEEDQDDALYDFTLLNLTSFVKMTWRNFFRGEPGLL